MANWTPGLTFDYNPRSQFGTMGKRYWKNELQNMLNIQSGAIQPTDLPEYKSMANQFNAQSNKVLQNMLRQLSQRGIVGGAAAGAIANADESTKQGLLQMIQNMFQSANQRGTQAASQGIDWDKFLTQRNLDYNKMGQQWYEMLTRLAEARKNRHAQESIANTQMWQNIIPRLMGIAAAPFTGGMSLAATLPAIGSMAGGNSGGITGTGGLADWYTKTYGGLGG